MRQVLQAQEYWRLQGLKADVVLLNEHPISYLDEMQEHLTALIDSGPWSPWKDRPGGIFLIRGDGLADGERVLFEAVARAVLVGDRGELSQQLDRPAPAPTALDLPIPQRIVENEDSPAIELPSLTMANGIGGFIGGGREYAVVLTGDVDTPAPWTNVLANREFGTIVTASGAAFTWSGNSRQNRLTPFANDPVSDSTAEAILLRDEESGEMWGATPGPLARSPQTTWVVRHRAGVTTFERTARGAAPAARGLRVPLRAGEGVDADTDQHVPASPNVQRLQLQRMGARPAAHGPPAPCGHQPRRAHRGARRAQSVQHRVCRPRRVLVGQRTRAVDDRRPDRVHRPQRHAHAPRGVDLARVVESPRRGSRSVRRPARERDAGAG